VQPAGCELQPLPTRQTDAGHSDASLHEPAPLHVTSHEHAFEHRVFFSHDSAPLQMTSQVSALQ
jgi:hypothetical protein